MKIDLEKNEIEKIVTLIDSRIEELRFDINDDAEGNEEELKQVIREYKAIIKKINDQLK